MSLSLYIYIYDSVLKKEVALQSTLHRQEGWRSVSMDRNGARSDSGLVVVWFPAPNTS